MNADKIEPKLSVQPKKEDLKETTSQVDVSSKDQTPPKKSEMSKHQAEVDEDRLLKLLYDLNLLSQEHITNGVTQFYYNFAKKIKLQICELIVKLNLVNCFTTLTKIESKVFIDFEPPEIRLSFTPADHFQNDGNLNIEEQNIYTALIIQRINNNLKKMIAEPSTKEKPKRLLSDIFQEEITDNDGFLITITLPKSPITIKEFERLLTMFSLDIQSSSPNELMLTQQFSDFFEIRHANPFFLVNPSVSPSIPYTPSINQLYINFPNLHENVPYRFLFASISTLLTLIPKMYAENPSEVFKTNLKLLNDTYISLSLLVKDEPSEKKQG